MMPFELRIQRLRRITGIADDPHAANIEMWIGVVLRNAGHSRPAYAPLTNHPRSIDELDETESMAAGQAVGHSCS
jgi:hypothetical protein